MRKGTKLISPLSLFLVPTDLPHGSTGTDRCAREPNRGYLTEALGIHPILPQSTSADPLTTSFKDTNRFCFTAPNHGSYPILYTETDKLSFLTLRTMHTRASIFDRTTQTNQKENGIIHQPILFSKQRDYGQLRKTFDADATLHSVSLPNDTPYIPAMFGILSFSLYRYAWYPLSSLTVSILTLVYVFVRYRYK
jgi:hypothetical protein